MKRVLSWIDIIFGGLLIVYIIVINLISSNSIAFSTPLILLGILLIFYHIIKDKFNDNKFFKITRKVITTLVCLGLICFSIIEALIIGYPKNNKDNFDYLIVLGAGLKNKTEVSLTLEDRLKAAMECIKVSRSSVFATPRIRYFTSFPVTATSRDFALILSIIEFNCFCNDVRSV